MTVKDTAVIAYEACNVFNGFSPHCGCVKNWKTTNQKLMQHAINMLW